MPQNTGLWQNQPRALWKTDSVSSYGSKSCPLVTQHVTGTIKFQCNNPAHKVSISTKTFPNVKLDTPEAHLLSTSVKAVVKAEY